MTATADRPPKAPWEDEARFDRDLETAAGRAAARAVFERETGRAPDPNAVRFDNPRWRKHGGVRWRGRRKPGKLPGVYLGIYTDSRFREWHLRADGVQPRGVLIMGPPGTGKSACYFIPTLLSTCNVDESGRGMSAFVYDPKGELFALTAGYAAAMGHKVLLFAPAAENALDISCHINVFDAIRWGTAHEIADVQNVVKLILDPKDKAAEGAEAHWIVTGSILLECIILWLHYNEPENCHLKGCYDYLTDSRWVNLDEQSKDDKKKPTTAVEEALKHMLKVPHSRSGSISDALQNGWTDHRGQPSPYHPYVIHSAIEIQGKAPNEKSGVVSTTTRFLHPFRDEILAELTSRSDFSFDDLMNHESPVRLYFVIPPSDIQRLRVVVSLFLQLLVRAHTGDNALEYRDGVPYYRYRHRLLLAVDEYAQLGKQEQFILALSIMRSYGLWPMLGVQSPNQIFDSLGKYQALTSMMYYKVFLKPNDKESAEWISENLGHTTKRKETETYSGNRFGMLMNRSVQVAYERGPLLAADTVLSMPASSAIVCGGSVDPKAWDNPIWVKTLFWEHNAELCRRSGNAKLGGKYPAPAKTDYIVHPPAPKQPKHVEALHVAAAQRIAASGEQLAPPPAMLNVTPQRRSTDRESPVEADAQTRAENRALVERAQAVLDSAAAPSAPGAIDIEGVPTPARPAAAPPAAPISAAAAAFLEQGDAAPSLGEPLTASLEDEPIDPDDAIEDDTPMLNELDDDIAPDDDHDLLPAGYYDGDGGLGSIMDDNDD